MFSVECKGWKLIQSGKDISSKPLSPVCFIIYLCCLHFKMSSLCLVRQRQEERKEDGRKRRRKEYKVCSDFKVFCIPIVPARNFSQGELSALFLRKVICSWVVSYSLLIKVLSDFHNSPWSANPHMQMRHTTLLTAILSSSSESFPFGERARLIIIITMCSFLCHFSLGEQGPIHGTKVVEKWSKYKKKKKKNLHYATGH